jgi:hypothetical protein
MAFYGAGIYGVDVYGHRVGSGGNIVVDWELWRATIDNQMVEDISHLFTGGSVSLNHDRAIKHQATFNISDMDAVTPYVDYLAVFMVRQFRDGEAWTRDQMGLYTTKVPPGTHTVERSEVAFTGNDLTAVLARYAFTDTYNIAAGTNRVTAVIAILALAGITRHNIVATTDVLAADLSFPVGTTYLDAANTLLGAIGYYHLAMARDGRLVSQPTSALAYTEPYRIVTASDLMEPVVTQPTDTSVANVVVVVKDNLNEEPLTALARNDDPGSPTSTANIGVITRVEKRSDLADQAAVDALAARLLSEGRTYYQIATSKLLPDPDVLTPHQTIELNGTGSLVPLNGRWWIRTATVGFTPDTAGPRIELNRVTDQLAGITL